MYPVPFSFIAILFIVFALLPRPLNEVVHFGLQIHSSASDRKADQLAGLAEPPHLTLALPELFAHLGKFQHRVVHQNILPIAERSHVFQNICYDIQNPRNLFVQTIIHLL